MMDTIKRFFRELLSEGVGLPKIIPITKVFENVVFPWIPYPFIGRTDSQEELVNDILNAEKFEDKLVGIITATDLISVQPKMIETLANLMLLEQKKPVAG